MNEATHIPKRSRGARIALTLGASVLGLAAAGLVGVGALALWGDSKRDDDGYLSTSSEPFESGTRAIVSENLDIDLDGAEWLLDADNFGRIRLEVDPEGAKPVFAGIARTSDVERYLSGVAHTVVTDIESSPFEATYSPRGGDGRAVPPGDERIWAVSTRGTSTQELRWDVPEGDWSVVVMNADGSPGVHADVSAGAKIGFLDEVGWSAVGAGAALLLLAAALALMAGRRGGPAGPRISSPVAAA